MQTEFPRGVISAQYAGSANASDADGWAPAAFDVASGLSAEDLELIDLRYDQFVAQAELDHLMDDL